MNKLTGIIPIESISSKSGWFGHGLYAKETLFGNRNAAPVLIIDLSINIKSLNSSGNEDYIKLIEYQNTLNEICISNKVIHTRLSKLSKSIIDLELLVCDGKVLMYNSVDFKLDQDINTFLLINHSPTPTTL